VQRGQGLHLVLQEDARDALEHHLKSFPVAFQARDAVVAEHRGRGGQVFVVNLAEFNGVGQVLRLGVRAGCGQAGTKNQGKHLPPVAQQVKGVHQQKRRG
jgi:hypothetical protein